MKISMSSVRILFLFLGVFLLSACARPSTPKSANFNSSVMTFQQFSNLEASTAATLSLPLTDPCDATCKDRRLEFRYVAYVGKQIYCYWPEKKAATGTDFDALAARLENSITTETSFTQYYLLVREWASSFHDGHVNVIAKNDMTDLEIYTAPIRVEVLSPATDHEKVIIASAPPPSEVSVGDEILEINGVNIKTALTRAAAVSSSGSTDRMRRFWAARRLVDVMGVEEGSKPLILTVKTVKGNVEKTVQILRNIQIDPKPAPHSDQESSGTGVANITARILPNSVGYLRIDGFSGSQDDFLLSEAMDRLAKTRGLILDLRKNGGGDLSGDRILERLTKNKITRYQRSERLNDFILSQRPEIFQLLPDATGAFAAWHSLEVSPHKTKTYTAPVVALTSPHCFSACDTFSSALKTYQLAKFVGESTGGGTGTPLVFDLPLSPLMFRYSVIRGLDGSGRPIEGLGTDPDVLMEPTAEDRAQQKDSQLAKAIEMLGVQLSFNAMDNLSPVWTQSTNVSPTQDENDQWIQLSKIDEL